MRVCGSAVQGTTATATATATDPFTESLEVERHFGGRIGRQLGELHHSLHAVDVKDSRRPFRPAAAAVDAPRSRRRHLGLGHLHSAAAGTEPHRRVEHARRLVHQHEPWRERSGVNVNQVARLVAGGPVLRNGDVELDLAVPHEAEVGERVDSLRIAGPVLGAQPRPAPVAVRRAHPEVLLARGGPLRPQMADGRPRTQQLTLGLPNGARAHTQPHTHHRTQIHPVSFSRLLWSAEGQTTSDGRETRG
jgi:hypothetical protein